MTGGSEYLAWVKAQGGARFNLMSSGAPHFPLRDLPVAPDELELSGPDVYPPLLEAVGGRYGVPAESVFPAAGTSMANHLAMAALLEPGAEVLVEHPTYEPLLAVARYLGARVERFPRRAADGFRVDPDEVARRVTPRTRLVVLTNLHNPSSALTDDDTLRRLGEIARGVGARVLVDEVYLDALFEAAPRTAFHLGPEFVVTSSLTKVYGLGGLRCGWVFAEPAVTGRLWRLSSLFSNINAHAAERLGVAAIRSLGRIAARTRALLETNGAALDAFFRSRDDLEWTEHRAGTVAFPRLRSGRSDDLWSLLRARYDTAVVPGRFFELPAHVRIGLGVDPAIFSEGLVRLGLALDELDGKR
ncbi:MAG: aminotransferase class I/II-fold pyridoxal phosphate-dependent enzyme [Longimicrobiaceae bacterium]